MSLLSYEKPGARRWVYIFLLISPFVIRPAKAQFPYALQFSTDDGLPGSEVYDIRQDHDGYIWISTDHGVSRYNGYEFENYTTENGLTDNTILDMLVDDSGRVWFSGLNKSMSYYWHGRIYEYRHNELLRKLSHEQHINSFYVNAAGDLFFMQEHLYCIRANGRYEVQKTSAYAQSRHFFRVHEYEGGRLVFGPNLPPLLHGPAHDKVQIIYQQKELFIGLPAEFYKNSTPIKGVKCNDSVFAFAFGNTLLLCSHTALLKTITLKHNIVELLADGDKLWVQCKFQGTFFIELHSFAESERYFAHLSVDHILHDREGNYWFATLEEGLRFVPSFQIRQVAALETGFHDKRFLSVHVSGAYLFAGSSSGNLYRINRAQPEQVKKMNNERLGFVDRLATDAAGNTWFSGSGSSYYSSQGRLYRYTQDCPKCFYYGSQGRMWTGDVTGFGYFSNNSFSYTSCAPWFKQRVISLCEDSIRQIVYLGTLRGLYVYKNGKVSLYNHPSLNKQRITGLRCDKAGDLYIATRGAGLFIIQKGRVQHMHSGNALPSNMCEDILLDQKRKYLWIASNKGISLLKLDALRAGKVQVYTYDKTDGLPSNEINGLALSGDTVFAASSNGVVYFPVDQLGHRQQPPLSSICGIQVNDKVLPLQAAYKLEHEQNTLEIQYIALHFKSQGRISYVSKLEGLDEHWLKSTHRSVRYSSLPSGSYTFLLKAVSNQGAVSAVQKIQFEIQKHFSETLWFRSLILVCLALILWLIVMNEKRKNHMRMELGMLEQKALRSQINPHFIFNAMNSIQSYIGENDKLMANQYLSKFSVLMRKVLDNSKGNFISLSDELATISYYLELEKLRLGSKFSYSIEVEPAIRTEQLKIPPFLLQPYIENAIWHGLMPRKQDARLLLSLSLQGKYLLIRVKDNGIGRKAAAAIKASSGKKHDSSAMRNIEERILILNKLYGIHMYVQVSDLEHEPPGGTLVELYVPLQLSEQLY